MDLMSKNIWIFYCHSLQTSDFWGKVRLTHLDFETKFDIFKTNKDLCTPL
jgi:hypothetical protein